MTGYHGTVIPAVAAIPERSRRHPNAPLERNRHRDQSTKIKGGFRVTLTSGQWWWSPGMFLLHGYRARQALTTVPSTRLVLAHRHPGDRRAMAEAWAHLLADGGLVAFHYRIIGADGMTRPVFAMAATNAVEGATPTAVTGVLQLEG